MKRILLLGAITVLVLGIVGTAVAATYGSIAEIKALPADSPVTFTATVLTASGNDYTLSDGVDTLSLGFGPRWYKAVDLAVGEKVTTTGEVDKGKAGDKAAEVDAYSVTTSNGTAVEVRKGPGKPPWAGKGGPNGKSGAKADVPDKDDANEKPDTDKD
ncbi:MAG: hypothetical protein Q7W30_08225 [Coriobacteriia bacterium]|nr:hypothetical protein [Coriobacteriia bacterium]